jgi:hypothetical protein
MLSKVVGSMVVIGLLTASPAAGAHETHVDVNVSVAPIVMSWSWMAGHFVYPGIWVRGHWSHPEHGKSRRAHRHGPPPTHVHAPPPKHKHQPRHYHRGNKRR